MQRIHIHMPDRMHLHRPDWHSMKVHMGHMVHDPRFWATVALVILFALMILMTIFTRGGSVNTKITYPYNPYWP